MKAVICGAGIAGLALANRLHAHGWDVVVLEKAPGPRETGYMIDFFGPGYDAAEAMGLLPRLRELGYRVEEVSYVDETGRRRAGLSTSKLTKAVGGRLLSIMRPDLERALREQLPDQVDLRFATAPEHIDNDSDRVRVTLPDGSVLDADLLVGADGIHSSVRAAVFGAEERFLRYLGFHTAAFLFDDPRVHAEVNGRFCLTDTLGRQLACYGLRDGRVAVFAVHRAADPALPDDARAALRDVYGSLGWVAPRALAACPPSDQVYYDQVAQIESPQWTKGRVVLLGDACQAVSLLAGQGASLAIAGAYVLAEQLARAGTIDAALGEYERLWRPVVAEKQRVARSSARWFVPDTRTQLAVRRTALRLAGLPVFDRYLSGALAGKPTNVVRQLGAR
ncbi:2-polyprenyl-6-methoxyphenol hydroxylase-like FAD-dependent oxidoreductase [Saccharopolyspora erythraea NRRL 2338]|uniref:Monooxygenase, FAD-binding n=2 Tax=Saccharopolyspora erythraea TaxID=1836 RepID=A4FAH1_SACEN|nr:FAD-dependent oxidoreductase [Saccharopolyspora erythraea]EQD83309.1 FAD-dependent oxidoreductase [Saccharopolyspora erythraea D]PFG94833.1 2-polyprenyl-6-methoxyphenol hydroxylase-like FAD-dependent oxidoreductase [Saccharopolyspora erythraea NRRL 2338]QRK91541.1 FAD-dependent monooxygenase [Saccharopolyspora erythraea]CAM01046.1 monooxygenase, FAD-binding [Saccharopolyspora erythraea NRRL 2338]